MTRFGRTLACLIILLSVVPLRAEDAAPLPGPHFRSDFPELIDALVDGVRDSSTLRRLVQRVHASDVVVYLSYEPFRRAGAAAQVTFLSAVGGWRYVRIGINPRYRGCQRLGLLAHELQHVVEIAEAPEVVSSASMAELYRAIGFRAASGYGWEQFDSDAAIQTGQQVQEEVTGRTGEVAAQH